MPTWTIANLRRVPLSPTTREDTAIKAGPKMNFIAMAKIATRVPHAIILVLDAMKRPIQIKQIKQCTKVKGGSCSNSMGDDNSCVPNLYVPKLNIAIPSPPFDMIMIDWLAISGSFTSHLQQMLQSMSV